MNSTSQLLAEQAESLEHLLRELIVENSGLVRRQPPRQTPGTRVVWLGPNYAWKPLDNDGRAAQAKAREAHERFSNLVDALLRRERDDVRSTAADARKSVRELVDQERGLDEESTDEALNIALEALTRQLEQVNNLYDPTPGEPVVVPDTNAIIWNPDLERSARRPGRATRGADARQRGERVPGLAIW